MPERLISLCAVRARSGLGGGRMGGDLGTWSLSHRPNWQGRSAPRL
jgi:hypothetical protein